jgi:amino acid adenylation domain-containing protein
MTKTKEFVLLWSIHHIVSDGWSLQILIKEFAQLYNAYHKGLPSPLKKITLQHKDYIEKKKSELSGAVIEVKKRYWLGLFSKELPILDLSTDYPRPVVKKSEGEQVSIIIDDVLMEMIAGFSKQHQASAFAIMFAAIQVLLFRYTNQSEIVIGLPIAGRDRIEIEDVIGCFINTLPIKTIIDVDGSFCSLLKQVSDNLIDAYDNADYPYESLIKDLKIVRDTSRSAIFDITINYLESDLIQLQPDGLRFEAIETGIVKSKFDLEFDIADGPEGYQVAITFDTSLFKRQRMENMLKHFLKILRIVLTDPSEKLDGIVFLDELEKNELLYELNNTFRTLPELSLIEIFKQSALSHQTEIAVKFENIEITYGQLDKLSDNVAWRLVNEFGLHQDDCIGLLMEHSQWVPILLLGILKIGGSFLPLNHNYPINRLDDFIKEANIRKIFSDKNLDGANLAEDRLIDLNAFSREVSEMTERTWTIRPIKKDSIAYIIYTSGSTGAPKGVEICNQSFVNYICWANRYYFTNAIGYPTALFSTLSADLTLTSIFCTLARGDCMHIFSGTPDLVLSKIFLKGSGVKCAKLTPSHISILELLELKDTDIEVVIVGGEKLTEKHISILHSFRNQFNIFNEYGPTEATVGCIVENAISNPDIRSIGIPIDNTKIYILDSCHNLQAKGNKGEICIGGICLAKGYKSNELHNSEKFISIHLTEGKRERVYLTGDIGRWNLDGYVEFYGRKDSQVKIRGHRVELTEIEAVLTKYPGISQAVVVYDLFNNIASLRGHIVTNEKIDEERLHLYLKEQLPDYMIPKVFVYEPKIHLNSSGKADKSKLSSVITENISTDQIIVPPGNKTEMTLFQMWCQILKTNSISIYDNFFEIGGDSISIIMLLKEIKAVYGNVITTVDLFRYNTIHSIGEFLSERIAQGNKQVVTNFAESVEL